MDLHDLESRLATRIVRAFARLGLLEEGEIVVPSEELWPRTGLESCQAASLQDRLGFGPRAGLRVGRGLDQDIQGSRTWGARTTRSGGFSVFVGDPIASSDSIERLARYVARPSFSGDRLSLTPRGRRSSRVASPARGRRVPLLGPPPHPPDPSPPSRGRSLDDRRARGGHAPIAPFLVESPSRLHRSLPAGPSRTTCGRRPRDDSTDAVPSFRVGAGPRAAVSLFIRALRADTLSTSSRPLQATPFPSRRDPER